MNNIIGALVALLAGAGIAAIGYLFSKKTLTARPQSYVTAVLLKQLLEILFLVAVYFVGGRFADAWYPLIGAVLGLTLPMLYFTKKLLALNKPNEYKEEKTDG